MAEILTPWLEGKGLAELDADEHALRVELAELQGFVAMAARQRDAFNEDARRTCELLAKWATQCEAESDRFGEYHAEPYLHGYLCGRGSAARQFGRALEYLGNAIRMRAFFSGGGGDERS